MSDVEKIPEHWDTTNAESRGELCNVAKQVLAQALYREGLITEELRNIIQNELAIVLVKKGWLGSLWDKFCKTPEAKKDGNNNIRYAVKVIRAFGEEKPPRLPEDKNRFNRTIDSTSTKA